MPESPGQLEFDFGATVSNPDEPDGFTRWREALRAQEDAEARRLGLPLRRKVEVQLECGVLLRGRLEFAEPELFRLTRRPVRLALKVGGSVFDHSQIARCIALD